MPESFMPLFITFASAIGASYLFVLKREAAMWKAIDELRKDINAIRTNYNQKFTAVHTALHAMETRTITAVNSVEKNMRESNHSLAENITKSLNRLEMKLTKNE